MLSESELVRYDRQILMEGFGEKGQEKLKQAKVFIAGSGGLGSPVSIYLAAAGLGTIRIVDRDNVELSNLNRQVLHWSSDIGREKVNSAADKLGDLNPHVKIEAIKETINEGNISQLIGDADVIIDAMDNLETRHLLNRISLKKNIPFFHGAVRGLEGRASTFIPGKTACFACMYGITMPEQKFPILGTTAAVIGSIQATEVIKYITGLGKLLLNRLLVFNGLTMEFTEFKISRNPECKQCTTQND
jgi:molybdopterin/thiamine biosynthesis adenylyltransferase